MVLTSGALLFSKLTTELVISPIENMIEKVNQITLDPLKAAQEEEERLLFEEMAEQEAQKNAMKKHKIKIEEKKHDEKEGPMETAVLENTLSKIGALLALGFGEAGSEIIAKNMARGGDVNPMLPGHKEVAIFGFCDIRNFTDATEVLQEGVMLFVNEIGEIVHSIVDRYSGAANKNIGDAFLLVWKLEKQDLFVDPNGLLRAQLNSRVCQLADMSLVSFLLMIAALKKSRKMVKYNNHTGLNQRMPNYQVKLGLGLHMGYAIEGPIGSYYKIDASYLSPNVNMAARLEAATKAYAVPILISGSLYKYFTRKTKQNCRQVDWVVMSGSDEPVRLFTVDVDPSVLPLEEEQPYMNPREKKIKRVHDRIKRNNLRTSAFENTFEVSSTFETNADLKMMREGLKKEFFVAYDKAFNLYVKGQWQEAKDLFQEALQHRPDDKPTKNLLEFMEQT